MASKKKKLCATTGARCLGPCSCAEHARVGMLMRVEAIETALLEHRRIIERLLRWQGRLMKEQPHNVSAEPNGHGTKEE